MTLIEADLIWNRALEAGDPPADLRVGDRHLSALLQVTGLHYNGGITHVLGCCTRSEIEAGSRAATYFGLGELGNVLDRVSRLSDDWRQFGDLGDEGADLEDAYRSALPDYFVIEDDLFHRKLRAAPGDFAPLDND